ncbi:DUF2849 domain-containing protein [Halocynthiibacter namhaensis]|uniref:DUF2849 domain-containing protein n=1 Tax=Halocynthiibacter namhaensis TaxID=1290553 RepID=UPI0005791FF6|nr:DUF2849 domain-containing protein [Halocynthiibacter namhaensis]
MSRRPFTPKVITANHLLSGDVIYWSADSCWVNAHADAALFTQQDAAETQLSQANAQQNIAVGVMLADAVMGTNGPEPVHFREEFRATGPSNYFHGKQADTASAGA